MNRTSTQPQTSVSLTQPTLQELQRIFIEDTHLRQLHIFNFLGKQLPSIARLQSLEDLTIQGLSSIEALPVDIGQLKNLKRLQLYVKGSMPFPKK